jgi:chemotaxis protein methyltransferase CheR
MLSDREFALLLEYLDRPWAGFRKVRKGVKKRIRRHMAALGCTSVHDYLQKIERDPHVRAQCEQQLAVTISRFFRDRGLWEHLREHLLPELMDRFPDGLAAWSAGCANGEEPYTLAMVWQETAASRSGAPVLQILATDADPACIRRAREGVYLPSSLKEVPEACQVRWFEKVRGGRRFRVAPRLREHIRWQVHHLLGPPPQGRFHLILLRNSLLTYYRGAELQAALARILTTLMPGGYLILGSHEHLPASSPCLTRDPACPWIYRLDRRSSDGPIQCG